MKQMLPERQKQYRKILQLKHVLGREGLNLLSRLLDLDPETRISAQEALKHPFLCANQPLLTYQPAPCNRSDPLTNHAPLDSWTRQILVDWLADVGLHFEH